MNLIFIFTFSHYVRLKEDDPYHSEDNNNHPLDKPLNLQVDKPEVKPAPHSITKENGTCSSYANVLPVGHVFTT